MQGAWLSFAATGGPTLEGVGAWPQWETGDRATMVFGARTGVVHAPRDEELRVLERYRPLVARVPG
jgi:carboxylesterase type B